MTISEKRLFLCVFWYCSSNIAFSRTGAHKWIEKQLTEIEDMIAIYYNYTDKTNPGDNSPRDLSYWLGSDSSVIPGSPDCSGSDSSVILGSTIATRKSKFGGFMMGSRAKARYFSSDRKIPSQNSLLVTKKFDWVSRGGDKRNRTVHLLNAIQALYQLSYIPVFCCKMRNFALKIKIRRANQRLRAVIFFLTLPA